MTSNNPYQTSHQSQSSFIGVDVSKNFLHIFLPKSKTYLKINNNVSDIKKFFSQFDNNSIIVYEPTGVYSKKLEFSLNTLGLNHLQIHPNKIKNLFLSLGPKNKTDKLDAKYISELAPIILQRELDSGKNIFTRPNSNIMNKISYLLSQIEFYKSQIKLIKQNIEKLNNSPYSDTSIKNFNLSLIKQYQDIIKSLENNILSIYHNNLNLLSKIEKLSSIPGISTITSIHLTFFFKKLEEKGFTKKDSKKMLAYSGLIPLQHSSGNKSFSSLSKKGDIRIRNALYMPAIFRFKSTNNDNLKNSNLGRFAIRMIDKFSSPSNKRGKSIACAIAKKILSIARAIYRNDSYYIPNYNFNNSNL